MFEHDIDKNLIEAKRCMGIVPQEINLPIFETPFEEKDRLIEIATTVMEQVHPLKVPLKVNFGFGENWAQAH